VDGGGLVASYRTSLRDEFGDERRDFGLGDVLGVGYLGGTLGPLRWDYMRVRRGHPVVEGVPEFSRFPEDDLLACPEYCLKVEARDGEVLGVQLEPQPARYWGETPETSYPTIVARKYGGGRVVYFPGNFGGQYWAQGFLDYLRIIGNALRWTSRGEPPVTVEGPEALEVTAYRGRAGVVVFLVNYQYSLRRPFRDVVPVGEVRISLRSSRPDAVVRMTTGEEIPFSYDEGSVEFVVADLELYEGILVRM